MNEESDRWRNLEDYEKKLTRQTRQDYDDIVKDTGDISIVAARYGLSEADIKRAKDYAFGSGVSRYEFFPERLMVQAWFRLVDGRGNELDEMFLNHEIYKSDLVMNQGVSQKQAHLQAEKLYPWSDSIRRP